jgi:hypothetical protein
MVDQEAPAVRSWRTVVGSAALPFRGRPIFFPDARAFANPSFVLSRIKLNSNEATPASTVKINFDMGSPSGRTSRPCVMAMNRTPHRPSFGLLQVLLHVKRES